MNKIHVVIALITIAGAGCSLPVSEEVGEQAETDNGSEGEGPWMGGASVKPSSEGPFDLRLFANRIRNATSPSSVVRPAVTVSQQAAITPLMFDEMGRSNELIIRLNYTNISRIQAISPAGTVAVGSNSRYEVEKTILDAVQQRERRVDFALGHPVHARYLKEESRTSPAERKQQTRGGPKEELEEYLVLHYESVESALAAQERLRKEPGVVSVSNGTQAIFSWFPDDAYFQAYPVWGPSSWGEALPFTQWGAHAMNFQLAWDKSQGFAQVGVIDGGYPGVLTRPAGAGTHDATVLGVILHDDIKGNYRTQFDPGAIFATYAGDIGPAWHATHVSGIIAAQADNDEGVAGGCPSCSLTAFRVTDTSSFVSAMQLAIDAGMQVLNWSGELDGDKEHTVHNCTNQPSVCAVMQVAKQRDVLLVQSSGNYLKHRPPFPSNLPAIDTIALAVGGTQISQPWMSGSGPGQGSLWDHGDGINGSSWAGSDGVLGPAKSVVSTVPQYSPAYDYLTLPYAMCGDNMADESWSRYPGGRGDGYGSCTGTSMAAPHVTALAGLVRSVNPLLSAAAVRTILQNSGNRTNQRTNELGSGLPNALTAVNAAIATNPRKLSPLFSFYSSNRSDSFYTTVPQMASAALTGTLKPQVVCTAGMVNCTSAPKYAPSYGASVSSYGATGGAYSSFPGIPSGPIFEGASDPTPKAEAWIFTTHENPKNASVPLVPLYRLSWKCDDSPVWQRPAICGSNPSHTDTTYTADPAGVSAFESIGYMLDGIEGYIYPKTMPQPAGTVRLMRKYNAARDDHAIFPETNLAAMTAQGYTIDTGSDWLGYVYPNTGPIPVIQ